MSDGSIIRCLQIVILDKQAVSRDDGFDLIVLVS